MDIQSLVRNGINTEIRELNENIQVQNCKLKYDGYGDLDILPTAKAGGFWDISEPCLQNSRSYEFSPQWTMPCPSFFYEKNIRFPSRSIFIEAFLSLLCVLPHLGQVHSLIFRFLVSVF